MAIRVLCVQEAAATRLADFCRKCAALSDAQQRAGDAAGALASLARCVALLQQLGFCEPSAWQPLVQAHVRLQAELPGAAEQPQPARRGKAAASKKAATAAAGSGAEQPLAASVVQHAVQLPQGSVAAVVEEELRCWAALDNGGGCTPATRRACRLLQQAFPPASHPLEHAGVLLALHSLGLSSDGDETSGSQLLERAVAALEQVRLPRQGVR